MAVALAARSAADATTMSAALADAGHHAESLTVATA